MSRVDIVFVHDLSPDHFGEDWTKQFDIAAKGAIPALTKMRDEGMIKAWGFGVNNVEPCLRALEVADPDLFLLATQYSIVNHQDALERLFPKCEERGVSIVVGAPYNSGYLAGKNRYNYKSGVPDEIKKKGDRIGAIAKEYGTDLRGGAAVLQCAECCQCRNPGGQLWRAGDRKRVIHRDENPQRLLADIEAR
jgi:D-threo-aldose 1-dehydrogenase